jgi:hypothetical protein
LLLLLFCMGQSFAALCGDVNSDGTVDILDALKIAQHYVGLAPSGFDPGVADVNGDGVIDILDALQTAQYYVDLIDSLDGCKPEPTPKPEWPSDPRELIISGNPGNAKLVAYANNEIDDPIIGTEGTGTEREIRNTIVVPPGVTYDGKGEILTAVGMGDGSQDEGQQPLFILLPWANIKNVTITAPGCEGIHMMGYNKLENIHWLDIGEDGASVRSYFPGGIIYADQGSGHSASDKFFQINSPCLVIIKNYTGSSIKKFLRQNQSCPMDIVLDNVHSTGGSMVMANTSDCTIMSRNVSGSGHSGGKEIPWVDGASDWDEVTLWDGPGSKWPK